MTGTSTLINYTVHVVDCTTVDAGSISPASDAGTTDGGGTAGNMSDAGSSTTGDAAGGSSGGSGPSDANVANDSALDATGGGGSSSGGGASAGSFGPTPHSGGCESVGSPVRAGSTLTSPALLALIGARSRGRRRETPYA